MPSKPKNRNTKKAVISGRKGSYKKAVIKVASGETIDFYNEI
jgi:large subunit ribosomal protein L23